MLVVEDELLIAMEMEDALARMGCTVIGPASTVARGLSLLSRETPDFAILDVNLGRERSTPVAEALRALGVPFVLATGYDGTQLPEEVLQSAPILGKPLDYRKLRKALAGFKGR